MFSFLKLNSFVLSILLSLLIAIIITLVYIKIPPIYVTSLNYSIVPYFKTGSDFYDYNGFYQRQTSSTISNSISLFASQNDFKNAVQKELNSTLIYMLSKTNGDSLLNIKLVSKKELDLIKTQKVIKDNLNLVLVSILPQNLDVTLKPLDFYNYSYKAGISPVKIFILSFSFFLILSSISLLLRRFYYDSTK